MIRLPVYPKGFTLIELSIVLVIIGLVVGGILTGREIIKSSEVRATITQIDKYNQAANTFYGKYGYLPGDIPDPIASNFGFAHRGAGARAQGDGNGILEGISASYCTNCYGLGFWGGEIPMFWVDLTAAHLIDSSFNTATSTANVNPVNVTPNLLYPQAKLGQGNYIIPQSNGSLNGVWQTTGINFFTLQVYSPSWVAGVGLTVQQAYAMDKKMDDGLPLSGKVLAAYYNNFIYFLSDIAAAGGGTYGAYQNQATPGSSTTCYDNGNTTGIQQYSVEISNGSNVNCALSFQFQ